MITLMFVTGTINNDYKGLFQLTCTFKSVASVD